MTMKPISEKPAAMGVVDGYGGGVFGPEDSVTREQFAITVGTTALGIDVSGAITGLDFADNFQISNHWAKPYVAAAAERASSLEWATTCSLPEQMCTGGRFYYDCSGTLMGDEADINGRGQFSDRFTDDWLIPRLGLPAVNYALNREIVSIKDFRNLAPDQYSSRAMRVAGSYLGLSTQKDLFTDSVA